MRFPDLKVLGVAFGIALAATTAAKILQFIGQYLILGDLFLEHGMIAFFFPGTLVMIGAGLCANAVMIRKEIMSFDNILKTYATIGIIAAGILVTHSVLTQAPLPQLISDLFGHSEQSPLLSIILLLPISAIPIVTYIFVTNWVGLWLSKVARLPISPSTAHNHSHTHNP